MDRFTTAERIRIGGALSSLVLAIVAYLISDDFAYGMIIALLGIIATIQIETIRDVRLRSEDDDSIISIAQLSGRDQHAAALLKELKPALDEAGNDGFFDAETRRRVADTTEFLRKVRHGELEGGVRTTSLVSFMRYAEGYVHATSLTSIERDFWERKGKAYLKANAEAIEGGVTIERIFICDRANDPVTESEIERHLKLGVIVHRVDMAEVPERLWQLLLIRDGRVVQRIRIGAGRDAEDYSYYRHPSKVSQAVSDFEELRGLATPLTPPDPAQPG